MNVWGEQRVERGQGLTDGRAKERSMEIRASLVDGIPSPSFPPQSLAGLSPVIAVFLTYQMAQVHQLSQLPPLQRAPQQSSA